MSLRDDAKLLSRIYECQGSTLSTNNSLLEIQEGNLLPFIDADLRMQLSPRAYESCKYRIPPINVLKRVVDKISTIYSKPPKRTIAGGTDLDAEMWQWYLDWFVIDVQMQNANEYFSMHRATALEPFLDKNMRPKLRSLPFDRFFVYAADMSDPLSITHFVKIMGKKTLKKLGSDGKYSDQDCMILYCYTDSEFLIIDQYGDVQEEMMREKGLDGSNPFGKIPFVYINRSLTQVNPKADTDLFAMTKLIPVMITDINYALMFQSFSIWYTVDCQDEQLQLNPNTIISLKSDPQNPNKPSIGSIKPDLDSDKAFQAIKEQLGLWLQSRGIRPGATGEMSADTFASGISKMVDEMDTTYERKKTIPYFTDAEIGLFELITQHMHPVFTTNASFEQKAGFTQNLDYSVQFEEQITVKTKMEILDEVEKELKNNLISQESALKKANPEWTEEQVGEELRKILGEREVVLEDNTADKSLNGDETPEV